MTEEEYENLSEFSKLESERNPLYRRLIRCIKYDLPFGDMCTGIPLDKILSNLNYLLENNVIAKKEKTEKLFVTPHGEHILSFPCKIPTTKFVLHMIEKITKQHLSISAFTDAFYWTFVIAAWTEIAPDMFWRPARGCHENTDEYKMKLDNILWVQQELMKDDCFATFINIWDIYHSEKDRRTWQEKNFIFVKSLRNVDKLKNEILRSFQKCFEINVRLPFDDFKRNTRQNAPDSTVENLIREGIFECFASNIFGEPQNSFNILKYNRIYNDDKINHYVVNKWIKNKSSISCPAPFVVALSLRKCKMFTYMNTIVNPPFRCNEYWNATCYEDNDA